jgi:hypothetical protein
LLEINFFIHLSDKLFNEFLDEKRIEEEKKIKKYDSDINLQQILKNDTKYMSIGKYKNYIIIKSKEEISNERGDDEEEKEDDNDLYEIKLKRFRKNKRVIKAYENMKLINEAFTPSLSLKCPRFVRNFERYDFAFLSKSNRNDFISREKREIKDFADGKDLSRNFKTSTRMSSSEALKIRKKIILPKIQ